MKVNSRNWRLYDAEHCQRLLTDGRYGMLRLGVEIVTSWLKQSHDCWNWYGGVWPQLEELAKFSPNIGCDLDNGERFLWADIHDILCMLRSHEENVRVWTQFLKDARYRLDEFAG